ncbi:MAG: hypothetical protein CO093_05755 [Alphaproteobacteria bacterium CG_4_9_14_3_um_filter_47_13]|nr:MAG: hypothetical protein CO093_05755 [Alphaproteobacteria bacterium CG_4_9_14_3_um_filter_47_13]
MKRSLPVQHNLADFFKDPCPVLSDNNTKVIMDEIAKEYDWIVEYGMGASTLYFLKAAIKTKSRMISVENNFNWFQICIEEILKQTELEETAFHKTPWSMSDIHNFINANSHIDIPEKMQRLSLWQESLSTGEFFRLSPDAKSRFSGKIGSFWPLLKPIFQIFTTLTYLLNPASRPINGEWRGKKNDFELILRNIAPTIKDQFGEAPNKNNYISAGIQDIKKELEAGKSISALFIIDGGPRHHIVQEILDIETQYKKFIPTIILCDASRKFYHDTLKQRQTGRFIAGSNKTLKGDKVSFDISGENAAFWAGENRTGDQQARQEIWYYSGQTVDARENATINL